MPRRSANTADSKNATSTATTKASDSAIDGAGIDAPVQRGAAPESGEGNRPPTDVAFDTPGKPDTTIEISRERAVVLLKEIGEEFVRLRAAGRSGAWAALEDRLMTSGHVLVSAGLISPKDWLGMATEIEGFRKSESGSQQAPGDFLAEWLSGDDTPKKRVGRPANPAPRNN